MKKEEIINNTFITYVELFLEDINHPALLQERKLNLYAAAYNNKKMLTYINLQLRKKLIVMIATCTGQPQ